MKQSASTNQPIPSQTQSINNSLIHNNISPPHLSSYPTLHHNNRSQQSFTSPLSEQSVTSTLDLNDFDAAIDNEDSLLPLPTRTYVPALHHFKEEQINRAFASTLSLSPVPTSHPPLSPHLRYPSTQVLTSSMESAPTPKHRTKGAMKTPQHINIPSTLQPSNFKTSKDMLYTKDNVSYLDIYPNIYYVVNLPNIPSFLSRSNKYLTDLIDSNPYVEVYLTNLRKIRQPRNPCVPAPLLQQVHSTPKHRHTPRDSQPTHACKSYTPQRNTLQPNPNFISSNPINRNPHPQNIQSSTTNHNVDPYPQIPMFDPYHHPKSPKPITCLD